MQEFQIDNPFVFLKNQQLQYFAVVIISLVVLGCDSSGTMEIAPKFTIDGQPLSQASIAFIRTDGEGGRASVGVTDDQGIARLTTFEPFDGVLPGDYKVTVIKAPEDPNAAELENLDYDDPEVMAMLSRGGAPPKKRSIKRKRTVLPEIYSDIGSTPLTCSIPNEDSDLVFDIKSNN